MEPPVRSDSKRIGSGRPLSAGHQRQRRTSPRLRRGGPLQEPARSGGRLLPPQILFAGAPRASPPAGSGAPPRAALLSGLWAERQAGTGMAAKGPDHLSSTTAESTAKHSPGPAGTGGKEFQNDGDTGAQRPQRDAGQAGFTD